MLTKKVEMYGGYREILGAIHNLRLIAETFSLIQKSRAISDPAPQNRFYFIYY